MKTEYLLPCQCGEKVLVDRSQAGLSVHCRCGTELAIPTLRGLSQLEPAEEASGEAPIAPHRVWGLRQGVLFCGATIFVIGLVVSLGLWLTRPRYPSDTIDAMVQAASSTADIEHLSAEQLFQLWQDLQPHPNAGMAPGIPELYGLLMSYDAAFLTYQRLLTVALAVLGLGTLVLLCGFLVPRGAGSGRIQAVGN